MKLTHLATATAAVALLGGAAWAQQPVNPAPGSTEPSTSSTTPSDTTSTTMPPASTDSSSSTSSTTSPMPPSSSSPSADTGADVSADASPSASSATTYAQGASVTTTTMTNGPIPDTAENRAKYGQPLSRAGKRTAAKGN